MRLLPVVLGLSAAVFAACGSDDGTNPGPSSPLAITAMIPATNATAVETGATVTVTFNQAINPATLTAATFRVKAAGVALPAAITYDAATRTARAAAPLVPGASYEVEVTTAVRTPTDSALATAAVWTFATRALQSVMVEFVGTVGSFTSLGRDANGRLHVSYLDLTNGDLKYATCLTACATASNWQTVAVDVTGIVGFNTALTVEGSGRIHVTYHDITNRDLKYATCAVSCTTAASWQAVTVEATGDIGSFSSIQADASGSLHVSYYDASNADLKYATCAAGCTTAANWQKVIVDATGFTGAYPSLSADATGRLHVVYNGSGGHAYATCTATCTTPTNWQAVTVDAAAGGAGRSLAIDGNGRLHTSYYSGSGTNLKYATCASACAAAANWQNLTLGDTTGIVGEWSSLAVDVSGRVHLTYYDAYNADLEYATCAVGCATLAGWRFATADAVVNVGEHLSLVVDASGRLHVSYYDGTNTALKYIE